MIGLTNRDFDVVVVAVVFVVVVVFVDDGPTGAFHKDVNCCNNVVFLFL